MVMTPRRTALLLGFPAIAYLALACDRGATPTEARSPTAGGPSLSRDGDDDDRDGDGKFLLGGRAQVWVDPENPANAVIRISLPVPPPGQCEAATGFQNCPFGTVSRRVDTKIHRLDNMLEFKAWFEAPKSCFGGAPRLQLAIDLNGDGRSDGNAFGYFGPSPSFAGCPMHTWLYEDLTGGGDNITGLGPLPSNGPPNPQATPNEEAEWDLTQFFCPATPPPPGTPPRPCIPAQAFVVNWSTAETVITTAFPEHRVCSVALVDEAYTAPMFGTAYYDVISAGKATWVDRSDVAGRGGIPGCRRDRDRDDDDDRGDNDGDRDRDGDVDADDEAFEKNRRERSQPAG